MKNNWRIYLYGRGLGHYRPFLRWCEERVEEGELPLRKDRNGRKFILINDLLPYKGKIVGTKHNEKRCDLATFLHDGVVAFGQVKQLAEKILDDGNPIIKKKFEAYLNMELPNVGYVCICIPDIVKPYLDEVGLGEWLE